MEWYAWLLCRIGSEIINAIHMPTVNAPPGSGLSMSKCRGQLTVSHLALCLSEAETDLMRQRWRSYLLGE